MRNSDCSRFTLECFNATGCWKTLLDSRAVTSFHIYTYEILLYFHAVSRVKNEILGVSGWIIDVPYT